MNKINLLPFVLMFVSGGFFSADCNASAAPAPEPEDRVAADPVVLGASPLALDTLPAEADAPWRVSTNALAWGMAITNVGAEYAFERQWSAALSLYYSAWDYFRHDCKFRTFLVRPEIRYWFASVRRGFFADMHLQVAHYNFALAGWSYRIQDKGGRNPAFGWGVGVGYRLPLRNRRWAFEAQLGAGIYALRYDRFENRRNGPLHDTRSQAWFGIDNLSVGISYNFR